MQHHCHARGCSTPCPPEHLMCLRHWRMVPKDLQRRVWDTYRRGQCEGNPPPSEAWHKAADDAIAWVAAAVRSEITPVRRQLLLGEKP